MERWNTASLTNMSTRIFPGNIDPQQKVFIHNTCAGSSIRVIFVRFSVQAHGKRAYDANTTHTWYFHFYRDKRQHYAHVTIHIYIYLISIFNLFVGINVVELIKTRENSCLISRAISNRLSLFPIVKAPNKTRTIDHTYNYWMHNKAHLTSRACWCISTLRINTPPLNCFSVRDISRSVATFEFCIFLTHCC